MKKYWKSVLIVLVIILSIGTFFINTALSADQHPEFTINKLSGEEQEIDSLVLEGAYRFFPSDSSLLHITADGAAYKPGSGITSLIGSPPVMIQELQEEYRGFMRGKSSWVNSYFENNAFLAYAEAEQDFSPGESSDFKFTVSVLEKEDDNVTSFELKVPDSANYNLVSIEDVQMADHKLVLITQNMFFDSNHHVDEKHMYTIDLASQEITSDEEIISVPEGQDNRSMGVQLIQTNPRQANDYLVLLKTETENVESIEMVEEKQELFSYHLATKEKEAVDLPEGFQFQENEISFFDGSTIYFTRQDNQQVVITPYSLADGQIGKEIKLDFPLETEEQMLPMITVKDGKLYAVSSLANAETDVKIAVVDTQTRETVFTGELAADTPLEKEEELYIYNVYVE